MKVQEQFKQLDPKIQKVLQSDLFAASFKDIINTYNDKNLDFDSNLDKRYFIYCFWEYGYNGSWEDENEVKDVIADSYGQDKDKDDIHDVRIYDSVKNKEIFYDINIIVTLKD